MALIGALTPDVTAPLKPVRFMVKLQDINFSGQSFNLHTVVLYHYQIRITKDWNWTAAIYLPAECIVSVRISNVVLECKSCLTARQHNTVYLTQPCNGSKQRRNWWRQKYSNATRSGGYHDSYSPATHLVWSESPWADPGWPSSQSFACLDTGCRIAISSGGNTNVCTQFGANAEERWEIEEQRSHQQVDSYMQNDWHSWTSFKVE